MEAVKIQKKGKRTRADEAIEQIGMLYRIEHELKDVAQEERHVARQTRSMPVRAQLRIWLDKTRPLVTPSRALDRALAYLDKYLDRRGRYTERGDLPIDNNLCEGAIRPFVVGRKN